MFFFLKKLIRCFKLISWIVEALDTKHIVESEIFNQEK